ncbi:hybrid sensor histidine kinase/response regulator [Aerosakkonema funiforme]|nr:hybrid sensor histidine kinase/response regulator [Aerosakkonema funiforme]
MSLNMRNITSITSIRILIVEDEGIIAQDMQDCLEDLGYNVIAIADTGEKALKKVAETHPDLVLMDIRLKGDMDGIQAAEQIWELFQIPVIYTTGHSDKSTLERAKQTAPFGYLIKPFEERELYVAIETALRRYQLEKQLKEREEWLQTIFRSIGDGVIVVDTKYCVKFLNPRGESMTGWKQHEAIDEDLTKVFNIVHEKTRSAIENPVKEVLKSGSLFYLAPDTLLISKNGTEMPIDDSAAPLKNQKGEVVGCVLVFRDITERRQAEERNRALERAKLLEKQMAELQRLNDSKDEFLSTVSHELRTPLSNIKMAIEMLEVVLARQGDLFANPTADPSPAVRYFQILRDQCERQLNLVNDLLDLQRLNADAYTLTPTEINLQELIPHVADAFEICLQSNQQTLEVNISPDLPSLISDSSSLTRIVRELINNACKYTPPGEYIAVNACALPASEDTAKKEILQLSVTNSGVEIPAHELPRVFDKFYRIPSEDRWKQSGTGLGLALVKKLVDYLNGSIRVESSNRQVSFIVQLPFNYEKV